MVRCLNVNEALGGRVRQGHVLTRKKHAEGTMRGAAPGFDTMLLDNRERFAVTLSINPDGTKTCIITKSGVAPVCAKTLIFSDSRNPIFCLLDMYTQTQKVGSLQVR